MFETLFKYPLDRFVKGTVKLGSRLPPELAVLAVIVALVAAVFFYRRAPASVPRRTRTTLSILRGIVLGLLVLILFQPVLRTPMPVTKDCFVPVLMDNSRSMRIEDAAEKGALAERSKRKSRLDLAREILGGSGTGDLGGVVPGREGLVERLAEVCPVRLFKFGREAQRVSDVGELAGNDDRTSLFAPLNVVETELRGVPVVAVVLVTDGSVNSGGDPLEIARLMRTKDRPIYCIGIGDPNPPNDYEVIRVRAPRLVRCNTNVEIYASIRSTGFTQPFEVILRKGNEMLETVQVTPEQGVRVHRVPLKFRPEDMGTFRYTVEIPPAAEEVILDNNRYDFLVKVADDRLPVLYLEGSPREEYRFLRRALFRDKDFRIASILRVEGPKKFILQGADDEDGLSDGYPKTAKHLYRFEAVIFGDVEADYLSKEQLAITEAFVRKRGGGFLMLGGVNSFNLGGYQGTVIEKMLPVVLPKPDVAYQQTLFKIVVSEIGLKHPVMRQTENPYFNKSLWAKAPSLIGYNPITKIKPGAEVLAKEPKDDRPVLVVQKYGAGRSAAFATGGSWHWQMAVPKDDPLHEKFWKQFVRWLALGSRAKLSIQLNKDIFAVKEPVSIRSTVLDNVLKPVNDAEVMASIEDPFGNKEELPQEWILSQEGVYHTQYTPIDVGDYKVEVKAVIKGEAKGDEEIELRAAATFSVGETLDEFNDAGQKVDLLEEIAVASGGKYFKPAEAAEIVKMVEQRVLKMKRDETVFEQHNIWDTPLLFGLLALALSVEWLIRRRAGMM